MEIMVNRNIQSCEQTPAHVYHGTSDFATILNDIRDGHLPTGTGKPFPVNFQSDNQNAVNPASPWTKNQGTTFVEPPSSEIIGPKAYGL